jgi:hypothetical protein
MTIANPQTHSVKLDFAPVSHESVSTGYYKLPGQGNLVHIFEVNRNYEGRTPNETRIRYVDLDHSEHWGHDLLHLTRLPESGTPMKNRTQRRLEAEERAANPDLKARAARAALHAGKGRKAK